MVVGGSRIAIFDTVLPCGGLARLGQRGFGFTLGLAGGLHFYLETLPLVLDFGEPFFQVDSLFAFLEQLVLKVAERTCE